MKGESESENESKTAIRDRTMDRSKRLRDRKKRGKKAINERKRMRAPTEGRVRASGSVRERNNQVQTNAMYKGTRCCARERQTERRKGREKVQ